MHVDYAIEVYQKLKCPKYVQPSPDLKIIERLATDEIVDFADSFQDAKISSICQTMKQSNGYRSVAGRKKITQNQQIAIASFLLEKCGSAEKVICKAFNISDEYIANYKS